jgi:hypothetical protein
LSGGMTGGKTRDLGGTLGTAEFATADDFRR